MIDGIINASTPRDAVAFKISPPDLLSALAHNVDLSIKEMTRKDIVMEQHRFCQQVIDYLNDRAGTKFQAITNSGSLSSGSKDILARKKEHDATLQDFYHVIDKKTKQWIGTSQEQYLRPITLFSKTKFENYLGELDGKKSSQQGGSVIGQFASAVQQAQK